MSDADHAELLTALRAHPGPVALSGYRSELYDRELVDWTRHDRATIAYRNASRVESLWINPIGAAAARQISFSVADAKGLA